MRLRILLVSWLVAVSAAIDFSSAEELDFSTWQRMPVFQNGRIMPVNTFARMAVEPVCDRANPKLSLEGASEASRDLPEFSEAEKMFPDGARKFTAPEILFSWMVEPERWEYVPFLIAEHEELREDILDLPILSSKGKHLKYISPYDLKNSKGFERAAGDLRQKQRNASGEDAKLTNTDAAVERLYRAYLTYRSVAYDPFASDGRRFSRELMGTIVHWRQADQTWEAAKDKLNALTPPIYEKGLDSRFTTYQDAFQTILQTLARESTSTNQVETGWDALQQAATKLADTAKQGSENLAERDRPESITESDWNELLDQAKSIAAETRKLASAIPSLRKEHTRYRDLSTGIFRNEPRHFIEKLSDTVDLWNDASTAWEKTKTDVTALTPAVYREDPGQQMDAVGGTLSPLLEMIQRNALDPVEAERILGMAQRQAAPLAEIARQGTEELFNRTRPEETNESAWTKLRAQAHLISSRLTDLVSAIQQTRLALFDSERCVRIVPGLNPAALEKNRPTGNDAQPWLGLATILYSGDDIYRDFLSPKLPEHNEAPIYPDEMTRLEFLQRLAAEGNPARKERAAFADAAAAYIDRDASDRAERFADAMDRFAADVRNLGESVESFRAEMELKHPDADLIALTAYPSAGAMDAEVHYYQLDPFLWSWVVSFLSLCCLGAAFGAMRRPMYWLGVLFLVVGMGFSIYGLALRTYVTGWAPVTNMFETVVFVALVTGLLGLIFAILPLFGPGLGRAWRLTAIPGTGTLDDEDLAAMNQSTWTAVRTVMLLPRIYLMWLVYYLLTSVQYGAGTGYAAIRLVPRSGSINDQVVWIVGLCMLAIGLWFVPRVVMTIVLSVVTLPWTLAQSGLAAPMNKSVQRKTFAVVGAGTACAVGLIAYYAPMWYADLWDKDINPLMPVLRDNFWLTLHVLSITASYGAGFLAWGLGITAMAYYAFGRYRDPLPASHADNAGAPVPQRTLHRRIPEQCVGLSGFIYRALQVAVVLLAAGTILGGLWADVSWGRFWGWDPKEVWALVSLLIYVGILHFRFIGILRDFALAAGAILAITSIMMAWWGVNFFLGSGMHSYGNGEGGGLYVLGFILFNCVAVAAGAARYVSETGGAAASVPQDHVTSEAVAKS